MCFFIPFNCFFHIIIVTMNALIIAMSVALLWGVMPIIHKYVLHHVSYMTVMFVGGCVYFTCVLLFSMYHMPIITQDLKQITTKIVALIACASLFCAFLANVMYFYVLKQNKSYWVSALTFSSPLFTLLIASLILQEKVTVYGFIGVILVTCGVVFLAIDK